MDFAERNYYAQKLNAGKLFQVYDTNISSVQQYLDAELAFVREQLTGSERVLELGAGYGRVLKALAPYSRSITGIDISQDNILLAEHYLEEVPNTELRILDVHHLDITEEFDVVLCLQNGLSAMKGQPEKLAEQALNTLVKGGKAFFSTYSPKFWEHRLAWFHEQANKGLLGEIDLEKTRNGQIVCKDGFTATTHSEDDLQRIGMSTGCNFTITEVDASSVFLVVTKS